jgi:predicted membrane-bound dolichyl-phosphate-mannose-protein mannosyltransferase
MIKILSKGLGLAIFIIIILVCIYLLLSSEIITISGVETFIDNKIAKLQDWWTTLSIGN